MSNKIEITNEVIESVLHGFNPQEHIIKFECGYTDKEVTIIYRDENNNKCITTDDFYPFCWVTTAGCRMLYGNNKNLIRDKLSEYGIACRKLVTTNEQGFEPERMKNGYNVMFYALYPMSYQHFLDFFKNAGVPVYPKQTDPNYGRRIFQTIAPIEQYMISSGKRLFKGYNDYDDLVRMNFDLETTGLDPLKDTIDQIGVRTNKGFEKILTVTGNTVEERIENQYLQIQEFFQIIKEQDPDVISGYNTENFDWPFIDEQLKKVGTSLEEESKKYFRENIYKQKKPSVLKLGGDVEYYHKTVMYGTNINDGIHAVRRAMAQNSSIEKAGLKYITQYLKLNKDNRVYVPGKEISTIWNDLTPSYAFNNTNGKWYKLDKNKPLTKDFFDKEGFEIVTGRYIVERYLLDDLYESEKVEYSYNIINFVIGKMLPVSFERACTMGTASLWKYIMMGLSYMFNLAIPELVDAHPFVGGISRMLKCGRVDNVVKFDYNSLYPSIILSYGINSEIDLTGAMSKLLDYLLTSREHFKGLKKQYEKKSDALREEIKTMDKNDPEYDKKFHEFQEALGLYRMYDSTQAGNKVICNGFFGSYGSGSVFPWSDLVCAEKTTCIGRQSLRLMIGHFHDLGYTPIVGDSVTYDTPVFIKWNKGDIYIRPICELFSDYNADEFENEQYRDFSEKPYQVLTRNGWCDIKYVYKHKTNKKIYNITTNNGSVSCTEDHSLFDKEKNEVKPYSLKINDELETYSGKLDYEKKNIITHEIAFLYGKILKNIKKGENEVVLEDIENISYLNKCVETFNLLYNEDVSLSYDKNSFKILFKENRIIFFFDLEMFTKTGFKKVPSIILNAKNDIKRTFIESYGEVSKNETSKILLSGINFIYNELGEPMLNNVIQNITQDDIKDEYVYDISADGTFVNALGMIVCHNTDGFDLQMPDPSTYRYTKEHPYIGTGESIGSKKGKEYVNEWGDLLEFNDKYMRGRMFCDVDEYIKYGINCSRKNYLNYLENGEVKVVGNTLKSKRMPIYIKKFMNNAYKLLLLNKGKEFIEYYYEYLEKIYNYKIPLKDIATVGKIKTTIEDYKASCNELTAAGQKKSRQAWYELVIKENLSVNMGDAIYYINTGSKKNDSDVKRVTKYFNKDMFGERVDMTKEYTREFNHLKTVAKKNNQSEEFKLQYKNLKSFIKEKYPEAVEEDEIIFNCVLLTNDIVEDEDDHFCEEGYEYNVDKYVEMFNKRITPLLVCFKPEMRMTIDEKGREVSNILVTNPKDRKYFTDEECELTNGFPFKAADQDTYEELMTMNDGEIRFWISINEKPMFADEMGIDWESKKKDYFERQEKLKNEEIQNELKLYNSIISKMSTSDYNNFIENGILPEPILKLCDEGENKSLISKKYGVKLGSLYDIIDKTWSSDKEETEE